LSFGIPIGFIVDQVAETDATVGANFGMGDGLVIQEFDEILARDVENVGRWWELS
jgi:hypothetical protein